MAAIAIAAGMRVDELAHIPLSFPTYAGILARVAASAARKLNLQGDVASKSSGERLTINFEGTTGIRERP